MGWWQINADVLAGSRFVISPLAEAIAALKVLERGSPTHPGERAWLDAHLSAYRARQAADPVTALLIRAALGPTWNADFLTPTPEPCERPRTEPSFEEEVERIRRTPPAAARADLLVSLGTSGPLPPPLRRDDLPRRTADTLTWVWRETVLPYWPRRRRALEADVVARTAQLSRGGWAAALDALRPGMRWLGDSRLQINAWDNPPRDLAGGRLMFVPVTPRTGWVSWEAAPWRDRTPADGHGAEPGAGLDDAPGPGEPDSSQTGGGPRGAGVPPGGGEVHPRGTGARPRYAVVYPCAGALAEGEEPPAPHALGVLLGRARAAVLVLLESPMSTTQLVGLTGQSLGSTGRHLKVLRDAGLVHRRRAGRSVLYYRTAAGDTLVRAQPRP
ncbi:winged helix-turn-helix domain-containing protein [Streptomyces tubbatahanensis]|uniref:Winged helix-turn-helix domain-containing protein n=1 Tax=Streptomyces tubbatahanensis TaxID=2923272 RepID=A0ABY3XVM5_9ACTN|nr:winged helix-turn-helix domain-containing protein [Streptomyces tubbatahanensis]UNS98547.1 winged helix-turn-helix domain-containing protein [Streptomyces tubbatahanensis]